MHFGFVLSLLLHAALLAWALFTIQATPELKPPEPEPIEVALIDASEFLRLKKGATDVTELEARAKEAPKPDQSIKEADKPKPITAPEPPAAAPPPEPAKVEPPKPDPIAEKLAATPPPPEPAPGPTPEEKKLLEQKIEAERLADEKKKADEAKKKADERKKRIEQNRKLAEQKKKEDEKKKLTESDRLAALLDKDPTKKGAPNAASTPTKPTDYTGRTAGAREGNDTVLSVRDQDLLRGQISSQIRGCWKLPGGGGGIETTVVTLSWHLRADGSLDGEPQVMHPQSGAIYQIAAEAAVRAVKTCSPFNLPPDKYSAWKFIEEWDFDPREMM